MVGAGASVLSFKNPIFTSSISRFFHIFINVCAAFSFKYNCSPGLFLAGVFLNEAAGLVPSFTGAQLAAASAANQV